MTKKITEIRDDDDKIDDENRLNRYVLYHDFVSDPWSRGTWLALRAGTAVLHNYARKIAKCPWGWMKEQAKQVTMAGLALQNQRRNLLARGQGQGSSSGSGMTHSDGVRQHVSSNTNSTITSNGGQQSLESIGRDGGEAGARNRIADITTKQDNTMKHEQGLKTADDYEEEDYDNDNDHTGCHDTSGNTRRRKAANSQIVTRSGSGHQDEVRHYTMFRGRKVMEGKSNENPAPLPNRNGMNTKVDEGLARYKGFCLASSHGPLGRDDNSNNIAQLTTTSGGSGAGVGGVRSGAGTGDDDLVSISTSLYSSFSATSYNHHPSALSTVTIVDSVEEENLGSLVLAGSDLSDEWGGWVEGAVISGRAAADQLLKFLSPPTKPRGFARVSRTKNKK
jgi:hypothetical protein